MKNQIQFQWKNSMMPNMLWAMNLKPSIYLGPGYEKEKEREPAIINGWENIKAL